MATITAVQLKHTYDDTADPVYSLDKISCQIHQGELIAILGHNGCGKSTLARHFNALIPVQSGELTVAGLNAAAEINLWSIRKACGMVFQNPDNQFVSSVIEEDLAFGPENYNISDEEIQIRIKQALQSVGLSGYEKKSPHLLSGGQKQRVAIAGVLTLNPDILIFDEATSMLDPDGRQEVLTIIEKLHKQEKKTILIITHYIEETISADRIFLMSHGSLLKQGSPREILTDPNLLLQAGLMPPTTVRIYYDLKKAGIVLPICPLTEKELIDSLCQLH